MNSKRYRVKPHIWSRWTGLIHTQIMRRGCDNARRW